MRVQSQSHRCFLLATLCLSSSLKSGFSLKASCLQFSLFLRKCFSSFLCFKLVEESQYMVLAMYLTGGKYRGPARSHILAMVSGRVLSFKEASGLSSVFGQFRKYLHLLSLQQHYTIHLEFETSSLDEASHTGQSFKQSQVQIGCSRGCWSGMINPGFVSFHNTNMASGFFSLC